LYDKDKNQLNKFIIIHIITDEYINYTYEDNDNKESTTVTIPIGFASLIPDKLLFNMRFHYDSKME